MRGCLRQAAAQKEDFKFNYAADGDEIVKEPVQQRPI
jgi:hypothetical protein